VETRIALGPMEKRESCCPCCESNPCRPAPWSVDIMTELPWLQSRQFHSKIVYYFHVSDVRFMDCMSHVPHTGLIQFHTIRTKLPRNRGASRLAFSTRNSWTQDTFGT
jgi:hypothetical protein